MATRKNEAAWVEERSRWQINVQRDGERKTFCSSKPGKKGKIEAERKADTWLTTGAHDSAARLGPTWDAWVARETELRGKHNTAVHFAEYFGRLYIKPRLQHKRISSITPQDWQDCIDQAWLQRGLSKKTLQNMRGSITGFWRYLKRSRIVFDRPDEPLTIPRDATVGERTIVQPGDLSTVFATDTYISHGKAYKPHYIYAWRFALATGMRPGEVVGLRWEDIDGDVVSIRQSINVNNIETGGKNKRARRTFALPHVALEVLDDQRRHLNSQRIISPYVFPATDGGPASERYVYKAWRKYCEQIGIPPTSLYEHRHTFVSVNYKTPEYLLKKMVGHSNNMDTRGQYGHEVDGQREITATLVDTALEDALSR